MLAPSSGPPQVRRACCHIFSARSEAAESAWPRHIAASAIATALHVRLGSLGTGGEGSRLGLPALGTPASMHFRIVRLAFDVRRSPSLCAHRNRRTMSTPAGTPPPPMRTTRSMPRRAAAISAATLGNAAARQARAAVVPSSGLHRHARRHVVLWAVHRHVGQSASSTSAATPSGARASNASGGTFTLTHIHGRGCSSYIHMDDSRYGRTGGSYTLQQCAEAVQRLNGREGCIANYFFFESSGHCNCPRDGLCSGGPNNNAGAPGQLYQITSGNHTLPPAPPHSGPITATYDNVGWCTGGADTPMMRDDGSDARSLQECFELCKPLSMAIRSSPSTVGRIIIGSAFQSASARRAASEHHKTARGRCGPG